MPFEWFVALRYLREARTQTALILSAVSIGVGVIVFLSALINGLQVNLLSRTLGSQPHVTLTPQDIQARVLVAPGTYAATTIEKAPQRLQSISSWQTLLTQLDRLPGVVAASSMVTGAAFATRGVAQQPVVVRGVDAERFLSVIELRSKLRAGTFRVSGSDVVIGVALADRLGLTLGDKVRLRSADGRQALVVVRGWFDLGNKEANERWVLTSLRVAQTLFDLPGGASHIELRVADVFAADQLARELAALSGLRADSWMTVNAQLLVGLRSQNSSKYLIELFVVIAVALGIASVLIVSVVQKSREVGIMRAVGAPARRVLWVFLIEGGTVGFLGSILGSGLGAGLAMLFERLAINADGSPTFPVDLSAGLFVSASALAIVVGFMAALIPAWRAARLDPARAIRDG